MDDSSVVAEVRPRSTSRKRRTKGDAPVSREPSQVRSRLRRDAILDATEALLQTSDIEDLSLSDIGDRADMSKASVHYHFPTVAMIQLELGRRHDREVRTRITAKSRQRDAAHPLTWQDQVRFEAANARDFFNNNRAACETLLGPLLHRQNRMATMKDNAELGHDSLLELDHLFELPNRALLEKVLQYYGEIIDSFWSGAYLKNGRIDDETFEESMRAGIAYLRNYLPEVLIPKAQVSQS